MLAPELSTSTPPASAPDDGSPGHLGLPTSMLPNQGTTARSKLGQNARKKLERKLAEQARTEMDICSPPPLTTPTPSKKKPTRGKRTKEATARRLGRSVRKWLFKIPEENGFVHEIPAHTLDLFDSSTRTTVKQVTSSLQGCSLDSKDYMQAPSEGLFLLRREQRGVLDDDPDDLGLAHHLECPCSTEGIFPSEAGLCPNCPSLPPLPLPRYYEPSFPLIRYELRLSTDHQTRLLAAIKAMEGVLIHDGEKDRRGASDSWHVGIWSKYQHVPYMTKIVSHQSEKGKKALNDFAGEVTELVVKPVSALLKAIDPEYYRMTTRLSLYVKLACKDLDPTTPNLAWGPLFSVGAFRWGAGYEVHLDNDPKELAAMLFTAEKFEGAQFCLPHVRMAIPFGPFTVILVTAGKLVHFVNQFKGSRFVFTGFFDYNTAIQAGIRLPEFAGLSDEEWLPWIKQRILAQRQKQAEMERSAAAKRAEAARQKAAEAEANKVEGKGEEKVRGGRAKGKGKMVKKPEDDYDEYKESSEEEGENSEPDWQ